MTPDKELGQKVCEALGLDPATVIHIRIDLDVHEVPLVAVTAFINAGKSGELVRLISEYHLEPKGGS